MERVALLGHGIRLVPHAPFELGGTSAELGDVVIVHHGPSVAKARLVPGPEGCRLQLAPGTRSLDEVAVFEERPTPATWLLLLGELVIPRPAGVTVWSVPDETRWSAELTLPGATRDELVYLLGPFAPGAAPELERLVSPGMTCASDERLPSKHGELRALELAYEHAGVPFRQWRVLVPLADGATVLVTAQAAPPRAARTRELAVWLATHVERR